MGKIVRRGIDFSGGGGSISNPTASSVTFDNTDTGLEATNVQDAVTEVNGKLNNKGTPYTSTYSDGRNIIGCLDSNNNGFSIILASDYIRFDFIQNGSATKSVRYSIKQV